MNKVIVNLIILLISIDVVVNDLNLWRFEGLVYVIAVLALFLLFTSIQQFQNNKTASILYIFPLILFFAIIIVVTLLNYDISGALSFNLPIYIKYILYLSIGINFHLVSERIWKFSILFIIIGFLRLINLDNFTFNYSLLYDISKRGVIASSSDILVVYLLLFNLCQKNKLNRVFMTFLYAVSIFILFISGSRTTLILFLLSLLIIYGVSLKKLLFAFLCSLFIISDELLVFVDGLEFMSEYRVLSLIKAHEDKSVIGRLILFNSGIDGIILNPIFGDFGGQITTKVIDEHGNRWGAYMHNILSYYRQFGLFVFGIILSLLFISCKSLINHSVKYLPIIIFLIVAIVFSRSYTYPYIFLLIGIALFKTKNLQNNDLFI